MLRLETRAFEVKFNWSTEVERHQDLRGENGDGNAGYLRTMDDETPNRTGEGGSFTLRQFQPLCVKGRLKITLDFHSGSTSPPTNLMSFFCGFNPHLYAKWGVNRHKVNVTAKLNKMLMLKGLDN